MTEVTYRAFTAYFMDTLKKRRDEFFTTVAATRDVREVINDLLKGKEYAIEYATYINNTKGLRIIFKKLITLQPNISMTSFSEKIDELKGQFQVKFQDLADSNNNMSVLVSMIKSAVLGAASVKDSIPKEAPLKQQASSMKKMEEEMSKAFKKEKSIFENFKNEDKQSQKKEPPFNKKYEKKEEPKYQKFDKKQEYLNNISKPVTETARIKTESNKSQKQKDGQYKKRLESKGGQKNLNPPPSPPKEEVPIQNARRQDVLIREKMLISANQVQVQVRYLVTSVDYEKYSYNGFNLKESMQKYIKQFLRQNQIQVLEKALQISIMQDVSFIKSADAGNYKFDPFCGAIEIYIKMKNGTKFDGNFSIKDNVDYLRISYKAIKLAQWDKNLMKLSPKSTIKELVEYICNKRQASDLAAELTQGLKQLGGANIVQDLYGWQKTDFTKLSVMPTYIYEIKEAIEQIKDNAQINKKQKSLKDDEKQCLKIANSHKILRYLVYKLDGADGVKKIAWLNMDNLKKAVDIVRKVVYNKQLLDQLDEYFNQFALTPGNKPLEFSRGLVLYGPPGTGKTVLTENLPNIIGFHLIENGLSAADFMKSLVGESSRMIRDLVNRAVVSPYLLCSVGIDEVDGLVPDRKDKDEKNKGEGISMLLSVIGGNKNVSNLVFMTSTNYLKKIDEAIRRRLSGQYMVGRPNPQARTQILQEICEYLKTRQKLLDYLIKITANFTGAALKNLGTFLMKTLMIKKMNKVKEELNVAEVTDAAILIAKQFSIKLGVYTLPQIFSSQQSQKFIFTQNFLERISNHFLIVKHNKDSQFSIMYASEIRRLSNGKVIPFYEKEEDKITINIQRPGQELDHFTEYIKSLFTKKNYEVITFGYQVSADYQQYKQYINDYFQYRDGNFKKYKYIKTVLIIQDYKGKEGAIKNDAKLFQRNQKNVYIIYYLSPKSDLKNQGKNIFGNWAIKQDNQISLIRSISNDRPYQNYSGRIMVELNEQRRMAFELNSSLKSESKVAFKLFLKSEQSNSPKAVIPELVDFFTKQNVSYILLIDYELLLQNDAFEEKKILQVMQQKMMEAKNYDRVAVIINLDSMVMLSESASDSNMGRSLSYSIQNHNLYQILLNYMREFAIINGRISRWMTVIAKHEELIRIAKKHLDWPKYPQQLQKQKEEEAKDENRKCIRCNQFYTERTNKDERKCMQHAGKIIDTRSGTESKSSIQALKIQMLKKKKSEDKKEKDQNQFIYACCLKNINEQGCQAFTHIEENQLQSADDELADEKINTSDKWTKVIMQFS